MTVVSGKIEPKNGLFLFVLKRLKQLKVEKFKVETDRCWAVGPGSKVVSHTRLKYYKLTVLKLTNMPDDYYPFKFKVQTTMKKNVTTTPGPATDIHVWTSPF